MIRALSWIKVEFDEEGFGRIVNAIKVMEEIAAEIEKISSDTDWYYKLDEATHILKDILNGELY